MSRNFTFSGGSQSDSLARGKSTFGLFKAGIDVVWPTTKKPNRRIRILPARDSSLLSSDSAYLNSVAPYRIRGSSFLDEDTKTEAFSNWYQTLLAHKSLGRGQEDFISPNMLAGMPGVPAAECADPVIDCHNVARDSGVPAWHALTERSKSGPDAREQSAVLPYSPRALVAFNSIYSDTPSNYSTWKNSVCVSTPTAHHVLKEALARRTPAGFTPKDPNWPMYLLGDITSLQYGLIAWMQKQQVGTVDAWITKFSTDDYEARDAQPFSIPEGHSCLTKRFNLNSSEALNIPTYQEIVDWMVADGAFPRELIAKACSHMANVPAGGAVNQTIFTGGATFQPPPGGNGFGAPPGGYGGGFGGGQPAGGFGAPAGGFGGGQPAGGFGAAPAGGFANHGELPLEEDDAEQRRHRERVFHAYHPTFGPQPLELSGSQIVSLSDAVLATVQVIPKDLPNGTPWALGAVYGLVKDQPITPPTSPVPTLLPNNGLPPAQPFSGATAPLPMTGGVESTLVSHAGFTPAPQPAAPAPFGAPQPSGFGMPQSAPQPMGFQAPQAGGFGAAAPQPAGLPTPQPAAFAAPQAQPSGFGMAAAPQPAGFPAPQAGAFGGAAAAVTQGFPAPQPASFDTMPLAPQGFVAPPQAPQAPQQMQQPLQAPQQPTQSMAPSMGASETGAPLSEAEAKELADYQHLAATNPDALDTNAFQRIAMLSSRPRA